MPRTAEQTGNALVPLTMKVAGTAQPGKFYLANAAEWVIQNRTASQIDLRQILYGKHGNVFRILYTIDDNTVVVLHIRHAAQQSLED